MRTVFPFLAALAVLFAGCDSDPVESFSGPTIQFGGAGANVSESDGTVSIPVRLTGGRAGETYTVQVLYASAASESVCGESDSRTKPACLRPDGTPVPAGQPALTDFANFGAAADANRVATVTLSGETDTQTVTLDIVEDSQAESAETAVFALQQATNGARIGDPREFRLDIGTPPIADVRGRDLGSVVTVEGVVTRARGRFSYLQDGSGAAIAVFASGNDYGAAVASGAVAEGDRVQLVGTLSEFNGLLQISPVQDYQVLSRNNPLPAPQTVTISQLLSSGDAFESELIRVPGLTLSTTDIVFAANTSYNATANGNTIVLRTSRDTDSAVVGQLIDSLTGGQPGNYGPFTFTGVLGQFRGTNQLAPIELDDLSN